SPGLPRPDEPAARGPVPRPRRVDGERCPTRGGAEGYLRMPPPIMPPPPPAGSMTFLLSDIERSTALWERAGDAFAAALASHHALLRRTFQLHGGSVVKEMGDEFLVAFERPADALACAIAGQKALAEHAWPEAVGRL